MIGQKTKVGSLLKTLILLILVIQFIPEAALARQAKLKITVYSVNDGSKVEGVEVTLINNQLVAKTNADGEVLFDKILNPIDVVSLEKEGYEGQSAFMSLEQDKLNESAFTLTPILGEVEVEGERLTKKLEESGFTERKEKASGTFLDEKAIERKKAYRVTDIFTGVSGIKLERVDGNLVVVTTRQIPKPGKTFETSGPCPLKILVDGSELGLDVESLNQSVDINQISAVEIYNSPAKAPVQYNRFSPCGVILIWTK